MYFIQMRLDNLIYSYLTSVCKISYMYLYIPPKRSAAG